MSFDYVYAWVSVYGYGPVGVGACGEQKDLDPL